MGTLGRIVIYSVAFGCGMVGMAFEILGSRVLAPDFGSTIFVWGSLIGIFLCGLSAGYYFGGLLSSRLRSLATLSALIAAPGVMMLTFPLYGYRISASIFDMDIGARMGPLIVCSALFLAPTFFLGAVTPYSVHLLSSDRQQAGRSTGNVFALSTIGSIIGTLGTAFFLILWMGTRECLVLLGGILLFLSIVAYVYHVVGQRNTSRAA